MLVVLTPLTLTYSKVSINFTGDKHKGFDILLQHSVLLSDHTHVIHDG